MNPAYKIYIVYIGEMAHQQIANYLWECVSRPAMASNINLGQMIA